MSSPTIASPSKSPILSYADRAKKAQNIRTPNSVPSHRTALPQASAPPFSASNASTASNNGTTIASSATSKTGSSSPSLDDTPGSSVMTRPSSPSLHPSDSKPVNGHSHVTPNLTAKALSIVVAHTSPPRLPTDNVWSRRIEQMGVQSQAPAPHAPSQFPSLPSSRNAQPLSNSIPPARKHTSQASLTRSLESVANGPVYIKPTNGKHPITSIDNDIDDPFVVRMPPRNRGASFISSVNDPEIWPEVGKSLPSTAGPSLPSTPAVEGLLEDKENFTNRAGGVQPHRKSEKPKWVPIPPEELQAAADDGMRSSHMRTHSRTHSQHYRPDSQNNSNNNTSGLHNAASGSRTQDHSLPHSGHNSASQSASHSRVNSRAGSAHSSPRFTRGRRLPGDDTGITGSSGYAPQHGLSNRSSRAASPRSRLPIDFVPSSPIPVIYPAPIFGPTPVINGNGAGYFPPPPHRPTIETASLHNQHQYGHPSAHPPLPAQYPPVYHDPSPGSMSPSQGYSRPNPLYPMYPSPSYVPYEYGSAAPPYGYWNGAAGPSNPGYPLLPVPPRYSVLHPTSPLANNGISNDAEQLLPPPTLIARPPPPEVSEAVAGYREVAPVPNEALDRLAFDAADNKVVFGSIGVPGASLCPSPAPVADNAEATTAVDEGDSDKVFTMFSIGVAPGEESPARLRSRTRSGKARSRTHTGVSADAPLGAGASEADQTKVIDLTDAEAQWEFGAIHGAVEEGSTAGPLAETVVQPVPVSAQREYAPPGLRPGVSSEVAGMHVRTLSQTAAGPEREALRDDEWEVKDFGYGFGDVSGRGYAPEITREEREQRLAQERLERERHERERLEREAREREEMRVGDVEREREMGLERERERDRENFEFAGRQRRGQFNGYDRGGFGGRRGRGGPGVYGRSFGRPYRGGYQQHQQRQPPFDLTSPPQFQPLVPHDQLNGYYTPQPLTTYIPTGFDSYPSAPPLAPPLGGHGPPPPVPIPKSALSFPLDPRSYYLLGQLEYYLSEENMAQDFFLRKQMDECGWIPITLLASFNRVRQLTVDPQLVHDVLVLSEVVQVRQGWARMQRWEKYVLQGAERSAVEASTDAAPATAEKRALAVPAAVDPETAAAHAHSHPHTHDHRHPHVHSPGQEHDTVGDEFDDAEETEEEEDVVFVMGREAAQWSPERRP